MESAVDDRQELARHVAGLIRKVGIEFFRNAVRHVAKERVDALDERGRREVARCESLKAKGALYEYEDGHDHEQPNMDHPPKPEGDWFHCLRSIRGTIRLPDDLQSTARGSAYRDRVRIFEYIKSQGFPEKADDTAVRYALDLEAWLPSELSEDRDPPTYELLPIPDRGLTTPEKTAILAAVHDAHRKGDEKVAPWGVSGRGDMPAAEPPGAEPDECSRATWYFLLTRDAREITFADISLARDWVHAIRAKLPAGEPADATEDGPTGPDAFVWQGKTYRGLARGPFGALRHLWDCKGRAARPDEEMAEAVYGDREQDFPDTAIRGLRQELNVFFRDNKLPFHASYRNRYLSIGEGAPKPARTRRQKARPRARRKK